MSLIHIARHGKSLGSFQEEEVREGIQAKRFVLEDLVWREGMNDWSPLHEVIDAWGLNTAGRADDTNTTPPAITEPAWERRSEVGFFKAIFQTMKSVLFSPGATFSKMNPEGGILAPLCYYVLMHAVVLDIALSYQLPQILKKLAITSPFFADISQHSMVVNYLVLLFIAPFFIALGSFISASIVHLSLKILGAAHQPWAATFRVFCYAFGSASLFQIVPLIGGLVAACYGMIVYFIGLKKVNDCSVARIIFSVLLSIGLMIIALFAVVFLLAFVSVLLKHAPVPMNG
ncbi:MAG: YIP1 family protein [Chthoniobacterales bacterium]